jgi:hypothetical protein
MEASGMDVMQNFVSNEKGKPTGEKKPEVKELTLAAAVGLGKIPVLPQELLKEALPGVCRALFK